LISTEDPEREIIHLWLDNGILKVEKGNEEIGLAISDVIKFNVAQKEHKKKTEQFNTAADLMPSPSTNVHSMPTNIQESRPEKIRSRSQDPALSEIHQQRSTTYKAKGGGSAPTAALVNREANKFKFRTEVREFSATDDNIRVKVRVIDAISGQYVEDAVEYTYNRFYKKKLLELIAKHIKTNPKLIKEISPEGQPVINPEIIIYDLPAPLFFMQEIEDKWFYFARHLITTCQRRCQDKMLNAEWREAGELELEQSEIADIQRAVAGG
jgi:hypothetical protein